MSDGIGGVAGGGRPGLAAEALRQEAICERFEAARRAGHRPRIEDHLPAVPEAERAALLRELILLEVELRRADGESPAPGEYEGRFPGEVDGLGTAWDRPADPDRTPPLFKGPHSSAAGGAARPDGRFRVLRFHAAGGLGAVYVARDEELGRDVALKTIKDPYARDPDSRTRFLLEAEVTGGLEHPGVVPVYGLDRDGGDRPYYAMRLIRGESLKDALARFHGEGELAARDPGVRALGLRKLLRRFVDACNAVGYAHSRGVIHRDLKPANVMLGPYGETLVVDWGLAKVVGRPDRIAGAGAAGGQGPAEATLRPGQADGPSPTRWAVGTPAYMSPEQAAADLDRIGPASDIYSLGATLYCLLAGKPPFAGDSGEVMSAVQRGEFRPPRQLDPGIDPALEGICLKAMARRPEGRYSTCREMADDLERWMADEPVSAWREPLSRRARRWARQHRSWVRAGLASLLVVTVVSISALIAVRRALGRERLALHAEREAKEHARREAARAEQNFHFARDTVDEYLTRVSENRLLRSPVPGMHQLRKELLSAALDYNRKFIAQHAEDLGVKAALARAHFNVGRILDEVGTKADAAESYRQAIGLYEELGGSRPDGPEVRPSLAVCYHHAAIIRADGGRVDDSLAAYARACGLLREAMAERPGDADIPRQLAAVLGSRGSLLNKIDRGAEAMTDYREALNLLEGLGSLPGGDETRHTRALIAGNLGILHHDRGHTEEALKALAESSRLLEALSRGTPSDVTLAADLARAHNNTGIVLDDDGRPDEALALFRRALAIRDRLARENPGVALFRYGQAMSHTDIGLVLRKLGRPTEAIAAYDHARDIQEALVAANPGFAKYRCQLATTFMHIGNVQGDIDAEGALGNYEHALAVLDGLAAADHSTIEVRHKLAQALDWVGEARLSLGRRDEALAAFRRGRGVYEAMDSEKVLVADDHAILLRHFASALGGAGRHAEAIGLLREAEAILRAQLGRDPGQIKARDALGTTLIALGEELTSALQVAGAFESLAAGRDVLEALATEAPGNIPFRAHLADAYHAIGAHLYSGGRAVEAIPALRRACKIRESFTTAPDDHFSLARDRALLSHAAAMAGGPGDEESLRMADGAAEALARAIREGYRKSRDIVEDPELAPIRSRADVQTLLRDLSFPSDPFAPSDTRHAP